MNVVQGSGTYDVSLSTTFDESNNCVGLNLTVDSGTPFTVGRAALLRVKNESGALFPSRIGDLKMTITYKWTDSSQRRLLKIDGNIRTCFKVAVESPAKEEYETWLAEGNTPLSADSE